jgi:hypothetical protein
LASLYLRLRFGKDKQVIRVSRWAADPAGRWHVGGDVVVGPSEIAVTKDGRTVEQHESDDPLQGVSFPFVFPGELD